VVASVKDWMVDLLRREDYYKETQDPSPVGKWRTTAIGEAVDYIQREFHCCGIQRWTDYTATHFLETDNFMGRYGIRLPFSCCVEFDTSDNETAENIRWKKCSQLEPGFFYNASCFPDILEQCQKGYFILEGAGFSAAIIGVIAVVFSITFATMNLVLQYRAEKFRAEGGGQQFKGRGNRRA
jgi:hypothetical protein